MEKVSSSAAAIGGSTLGFVLAFVGCPVREMHRESGGARARGGSGCLRGTTRHVRVLGTTVSIVIWQVAVRLYLWIAGVSGSRRLYRSRGVAACKKRQKEAKRPALKHSLKYFLSVDR